MSLFLLYTTESSFSLFDCYGLFKIRENDISKFVDERPRFRKVVDLVAFYTFESSDAPTQVKALSEGHVTAKLQSFLLSNLPKFVAEKKPEFSLGVADTKLGLRIFRPCNMDKPPAKKRKKEEGVSLLKYEFCGCMVEDLKKGKTKKHAAALKDMISIHYTVTRMKDDKLLLDTATLGDPVKFRLGTGQVIYALDTGICGMFVGGERRFEVPVCMGYESKSGRGTIGVHGPKGASGHRLVIDVTLVDVEF